MSGARKYLGFLVVLVLFSSVTAANIMPKTTTNYSENVTVDSGRDVEVPGALHGISLTDYLKYSLLSVFLIGLLLYKKGLETVKTDLRLSLIPYIVIGLVSFLLGNATIPSRLDTIILKSALTAAIIGVVATIFIYREENTRQLMRALAIYFLSLMLATIIAFSSQQVVAYL